MSRTNKPIWQDTIVTETGVSLQHLVNDAWQDTGMRIMPVPAGYEPEAAINRFVEDDLKSTKPEFVGETAITVQPYAYQVYKFSGETSEYGFLNDWSYEEWTGDTRCLSAPINRHADSRQRLVYGNFSETGNSIIIKELIRPVIKIEPKTIIVSADQAATGFEITSNLPYELSTDSDWFTVLPTSGDVGSQLFYVAINENHDLSDRQAVITLTHESYWDLGTETITACTITQRAIVPSFYVSPLEQGITWDTSDLVNFVVNTNVPFTASTEASWLTYSGQSQAGYHSYNVYFTASNNSGDTREATVFFQFQVDATGGTQVLTSVVRQNHAPIITIEPQSKKINYAAQDINIQVTSERDWVASSSESWLTVPSSGVSGITLIYINVSANMTTENRNGSVLFSNGVRQTTFNLIQKKDDDTTKKLIYVSTNNNKVTPNSTTVFGANIVSNTYYPNEGYGEIVFDGDVTSIGFLAFYRCETLLGIIIPDSVTNIGTLAFTDCALSSLTIPDSVISIGGTAFQGCDRLSSVTIPDNVTSIGSLAFQLCRGLSGITIGSGVTTIDSQAFTRCSSVTSVTVNDRNITYNDGNGSNCIIETATDKLIYGCETTIIPSTVTSIGSYAFDGCSYLSGVTLPSGITSIGEYAFNDCIGLLGITIPSGVTAIEQYTFNNCSYLYTANIPNTITSIGRYAFYGCKRLSSITIPSGVTTIGDNAFCLCNALKSIRIPSGVTTIEESTFSNCTSLSSVTIEGDVTTIGNSAFSHCKLTSITIPDSVTTIGNEAFRNCTSLSSITIPDSVTSVGNMAFYSGSSLSSVTIGSGVTTIGYSAFASCGTLSTINYNGTTQEWATITKGAAWNNGVPATVVHCSDGDVNL